MTEKERSPYQERIAEALRNSNPKEVKKQVNGMEALGTLVFMIVTLAATVGINGYVISVLWQWFIASTFGLMQITVVQAIGVSLFIAYFKPNKPALSSIHKANLESKESEGMKLLKMVGNAIFSGAVILGFGWIILQYM